MNLFQLYPAYFEDLATHHIDIQHSASNERFFSMNLEDIIYSGKTINQHFIVVLEDFEGQYEDQGSNNIRDNQEINFYVLKKIQPTSLSEQRVAVDDCKTIAEDFMTHIRKDYFAHRDAIQKDGLIQDFHPNTVAYIKVGPIFTSFYGMRFTFHNGQKKSLAYNPAKWI